MRVCVCVGGGGGEGVGQDTTPGSKTAQTRWGCCCWWRTCRRQPRQGRGPCTRCTPGAGRWGLRCQCTRSPRPGTRRAPPRVNHPARGMSEQRQQPTQAQLHAGLPEVHGQRPQWCCMGRHPSKRTDGSVGGEGGGWRRGEGRGGTTPTIRKDPGHHHTSPRGTMPSPLKFSTLLLPPHYFSPNPPALS